MPDDPQSNSVTKTKAATIYRRSERSLSRDITNAIKLQDEAVLKHVELQLEDGTRRPGPELTIREIVELRDRGLNPTWLLRTQWLKETYGRRDEPPLEGARLEPPETLVASAATSIALPEDLAQRAAVLAAQNVALERLNADLKSQTLRLEKELDRRAEERREENELQKQNNVLMQQVYDLLSKMQQSTGQITILPAPRATSMINATEAEIAVEGERPATGKGTRPAKQTPVRKQLPPRRRSVKQSKQSQPAFVEQLKPTATIVNKYLPTLGRAARFFSRK